MAPVRALRRQHSVAIAHRWVLDRGRRGRGADGYDGHGALVGMARSRRGRGRLLWQPRGRAAALAPRMAIWNIEAQRRPMATSASGGHGRGEAIAVTVEAGLPRGADEGGGLPLALGKVVGSCDVFERDPALDVFTGEDGILIPVHEDADVSRNGVDRHRG